MFCFIFVAKHLLKETKLWDRNPIKLDISAKVEIYEHKALLNILEE